MPVPEAKSKQELAKDVKPDSDYKTLDEMASLFEDQYVVSSTSTINRSTSQEKPKETKLAN